MTDQKKLDEVMQALEKFSRAEVREMAVMAVTAWGYPPELFYR
jgi:hypothetical protein